MKYKHTEYTDSEIALLKEMVLAQKVTGLNMVNKSSRVTMVDNSKLVGSKEYMKTKQPAHKEAKTKNKLLMITSKMTLFKDMQNKEIGAITKAHKHEILKKDYEVIPYGSSTKKLYFVMNGAIKKIDYDNEDIEDRVYKRGEYINADLFLTHHPSSCDYLVASLKCEIFSFELNEEYIKRAPSTYIKFYKNLALSIVE
jgi:hypothetical protein